MKFLPTFLTLIILIVLLTGYARADIINVPEDYGTISMATENAASGDTILIADGYYEERIDVYSKSLSIFSHFIIDNDSSHIYGTVIDDIWSSFGTLVLAGFTIVNDSYLAGENISISHMVFNRSLTVNGCDEGEITNILAQDLTILGSNQLAVINCTMNLIQVGKDSSPVVVINTLAQDMYVEGSYPLLIVRYSYYWGDGEGNFHGSSWRSFDSLFADQTKYLSDSSAAIGAGTDSILIDETWYYAPTVDLNGFPRPNPAGSRPDAGAFEHEQAGPPRTIYISKSGSDETGDGSEGSPFETIQKGIDESDDGDIILVTVGTYQENINFNGKNIVVGSLTLTTGDTSYISQTVIDGGNSGSVVTIANGEDSTTVLFGFTITNGSGTELYSNYSGGGGVYCVDSNPTLSHLVIIQNQCVAGDGAEGGGIYCVNSEMKINKSIISNNYASYGPGLISMNNSTVKISDCYLSDNPVEYYSTAIQSLMSNVLFDNTVFSKIDGDNNQGIIINLNSKLTFINCTYFHNSLEEFVPIFITDDIGKFSIINSIFYSNIGYPNIGSFNPDSFSIANSCFNWNFRELYEYHYDEGNIIANPSFVNSSSYNYSLSDTSTCIGAGIESLEIDGNWYYAPIHDIDGNPRPNPSGSKPDMGAIEHPYGSPGMVPYPIISMSVDTIKFSAELNNTDIQYLTLYNSGGVDLQIDLLYFDTHGWQPELESDFPYQIGEYPNSISPHDSAIIEITFTAKESIPAEGLTGVDLVVDSNDSNDPSLNIRLWATIIDPANISYDNKFPSKFEIFQNYPNPFNPSTTIEFTLPKSEFVELKVFNILGREVSTLVSNKLNQGNHTYTFDGKNLASGIYYYQLVAGDPSTGSGQRYLQVKKMILIK